MGACVAIERQCRIVSRSTGRSTSSRVAPRGGRQQLFGRQVEHQALLVGLVMPQEPLDLARQLVAGRQVMLLHVARHRLQLLDGLAQHGVAGHGRVVAGSLLVLLVVQVVHLQVDLEVAAEPLQQRDAGGGVADAGVGRHLREESDGGDAGSADRHLQRRQCCRRHPQQALGAGRCARAEQAIPRGRCHHRHRHGVSDRSGHRAEADPKGHAQRCDQRGHVGRQLLPAQIGLGAGEDQQVAAVHGHMADRQLRPAQIRQPDVLHVQDGRRDGSRRSRPGRT